MMEKSWADLPPELIPEILLRSPVKTLLRWKCVCKSWRSLISDHNFKTSHYELASSSGLHTLLYFEGNAYHHTLSLDFNAPSHNEPRLDFNTPSHNDVPAFNSLCLDFLSSGSYPKVGGSCREFLLLHLDSYSYSYPGFFLWNPSTGIHKKIPNPPKTYYQNAYYMYGFTYDSSIDDYIVILVSDKDPRISSMIDLKIFSLKANKWKQIERDSHLPYTVICYFQNFPVGRPSRVGSILNGAMHWFIHNHKTSSNVIIAFDLKETIISVIALPDDLYINYFTSDYGVLVSGGRLKAFTVEKGTVKIWVMKEYAEDSSWTRTLVFSMNLIPITFFSLLSFTNCGDIVGACNNVVIKINNKGQLLERYSYYHDNYLQRTQLIVHTESLLSV